MRRQAVWRAFWPKALERGACAVLGAAACGPGMYPAAIEAAAARAPLS